MHWYQAVNNILVVKYPGNFKAIDITNNALTSAKFNMQSKQWLYSNCVYKIWLLP